ncbi:hypothetical protein LEMLEM_LOCUS5313 [Lemmus lemmus]
MCHHTDSSSPPHKLPITTPWRLSQSEALLPLPPPPLATRPCWRAGKEGKLWGLERWLRG